MDASPWKREWLVIGLVTLLGAILRCWSLGALSLGHFDEGVYALGGLWVLSRDGLFGLDPSLIPYAPPGFPILVGLAYGLLGVSDLAAISVSILAGIATVPVLGGLARMVFGAGAGAAAATLAAFSLVHVAYSRMALTDATFLLVWVVALGAGARFLERPGWIRAVTLGLGVGVAQNLKYNGWVAGAIVAFTPLAGILFHPQERRVSPLLRTYGLGLIAIATAALIYVPWYRFVETHGGYAPLLQHHRGYMNPAGWWSNLGTQLGEGEALSGESYWGPLIATVASLASRFAQHGSTFGRPSRDRVRPGQVLCRLVLLLAFASPAYLGWWVGLVWAPLLLRDPRPACRLVGAWWLVLVLLTPLYHPYARLWLPLHAQGWVVLAGILVTSRGDDPIPASAANRARGTLAGRHLGYLGSIAVGCGVAAGAHAMMARPSVIPWRRVLEPGTDTLRRFVFQVVPRRVPPDGTLIRVCGRRPLAYYLLLQRKHPIQLEPDLASLARPGPPGSWAIGESVIEPHGPAAFESWLRRQETPVTTDRVELDPVTLLDHRPDAAFEPDPRGFSLVGMWQPGRHPHQVGPGSATRSNGAK